MVISSGRVASGMVITRTGTSSAGAAATATAVPPIAPDASHATTLATALSRDALGYRPPCGTVSVSARCSSHALLKVRSPYPHRCERASAPSSTRNSSR
ncbi:MAG: hypothetical protein ACRDTG_02605 [Pseudonocardiaceae bacterium]